MKLSHNIFKWLTVCSVAMSMIAVATVQAAERTAEVVRIKGSARYSTGGNVWQPLKVGTQLTAGAVVQTAADSAVDVVFSEAISSAPRRPSAPGAISYNPTASRDIIRIQPDSVLAIDKVTLTETGADKVTDTELDLRSGRVIGSVKKVSAASTFEVKIPNGVAGIRGTLFSISALGVIQVIEGSVAVAIQTPQGPKVEVIQAGFEYDIRTGEIRAITEVFATPTYAPGTPEVSVPAPVSYVSTTTGSAPPVDMENED